MYSDLLNLHIEAEVLGRNGLFFVVFYYLNHNFMLILPTLCSSEPLHVATFASCSLLSSIQYSDTI